MATLKGVIELVDDIKPNAFSDAVKTQWLNECEGVIQTEVMLLDVAACISYSYERDKDAVLLVQPPHDKVYWTYLVAMIDFANGPQKAQGVGHCGAGLAHPLRALVLGHAVLLRQHPVALGLLNGVQILSLEVFDHGQLGRLAVIGLDHDDRNLL